MPVKKMCDRGTMDDSIEVGTGAAAGANSPANTQARAFITRRWIAPPCFPPQQRVWQVLCGLIARLCKIVQDWIDKFSCCAEPSLACRHLCIYLLWNIGGFSLLALWHVVLAHYYHNRDMQKNDILGFHGMF